MASECGAKDSQWRLQRTKSRRYALLRPLFIRELNGVTAAYVLRLIGSDLPLAFALLAHVSCASVDDAVREAALESLVSMNLEIGGAIALSIGVQGGWLGRSAFRILTRHSPELGLHCAAKRFAEQPKDEDWAFDAYDLLDALQFVAPADARFYAERLKLEFGEQDDHVRTAEMILNNTAAYADAPRLDSSISRDMQARTALCESALWNPNPDRARASMLELTSEDPRFAAGVLGIAASGLELRQYALELMRQLDPRAEEYLARSLRAQGGRSG